MNRIRHTLSEPALKRMPTYFRTLRIMLVEGKLRVTSSELSVLTGYTIALVRLDLKKFTNAGQRGYGYNVRELYTAIASCLGTGFGYKAICVGEATKQEWLESLCGRCGVRLIGTVGNEAGEEAIIEAVHATSAEIGIILPNCKEPEPALHALAAGGVKGVVNYADQTLFHPELVVRNCSLSDPLLAITGDTRVRMTEGTDGPIE